MLDRRDRSYPYAGDAAERVVGIRVRGVEADRNRPDARRSQPLCRRSVEEIPARAHRHHEPPFGPVPGDIEDILPHQGFSPGEDDDGLSDARELVDDRERFGGREDPFRFVLAGVCVAVGAFQRAAEGDVP